MAYKGYKQKYNLPQDLSVNMAGVNETLAKFSTGYEKKINKALQDALPKAVEVVYSNLNEYTPVDTGNLIESLTTEYTSPYEARIFPDPTKFERPPHYYIDQEYGWIPRGSKKRVPGRYFMRKSKIASEPKINKIFIESIKASI